MTDPVSAVSALTRRASHAGAAVLADPARLAGLSAIVLGAFFVLGVGFAGSEAVHAAAHDSRHAMAFPCH